MLFNDQRSSHIQLYNVNTFYYLSQGGPPSRASSAEADDRTPPPQLPTSPFITPADTKLFASQHNYSYGMTALNDPSALAGTKIFYNIYTSSIKCVNIKMKLYDNLI